jgi:bifunctional non-homologous end joining protein LigD
MKMPTNIKPMLATLSNSPFDHPEWLFEIKHDGFRIIAYISKDEVRLKTKNNVDYTDRFKPVADEFRKWKIEAVVDGEIVVLNKKGISDFNALLNWKNGKEGELCYYVFDLLFKGRNYLKDPLIKRKAALKRIIPKSHTFIRYCNHIEKFGNATYKWAKKHCLEGIVAKKRSSIYRPGIRTKNWLKIKIYKDRLFVIGGYTRQEGPSQLSSLLLGVYNKNNFEFAGEVMAGINSMVVKEILSKIKVTKKCPFVKLPVLSGRWGRKAPAEIIWCRPALVCSIKYLEWTKNELRHASFKGLRANKKAIEVAY